MHQKVPRGKHDTDLLGVVLRHVELFANPRRNLMSRPVSTVSWPLSHCQVLFGNLNWWSHIQSMLPPLNMQRCTGTNTIPTWTHDMFRNFAIGLKLFRLTLQCLHIVSFQGRRI